MQHSNPKHRMPAGFPGAFPQHQQSIPSLFSPTGFSGSLSNQGSTETMPGGELNKSAISESNMARHCRIGQETVHEIINKSLDMFNVLKGTQVSTVSSKIDKSKISFYNKFDFNLVGKI